MSAPFRTQKKTVLISLKEKGGLFKGFSVTFQWDYNWTWQHFILRNVKKSQMNRDFFLDWWEWSHPGLYEVLCVGNNNQVKRPKCRWLADDSLWGCCTVRKNQCCTTNAKNPNLLQLTVCIRMQHEPYAGHVCVSLFYGSITVSNALRVLNANFEQLSVFMSTFEITQ